jgi:hypothetical protein
MPFCATLVPFPVEMLPVKMPEEADVSVRVMSSDSERTYAVSVSAVVPSVLASLSLTVMEILPPGVTEEGETETAPVCTILPPLVWRIVPALVMVLVVAVSV